MVERIFTPVLAFMLLAGGTLAVGSELFGANRAPAATPAQLAVIQLPRVEVMGHRIAAPVSVTVAETDAAGNARASLQ